MEDRIARLCDSSQESGSQVSIDAVIKVVTKHFAECGLGIIRGKMRNPDRGVGGQNVFE